MTAESGEKISSNGGQLLNSVNGDESKKLVTQEILNLPNKEFEEHLDRTIGLNAENGDVVGQSPVKDVDDSGSVKGIILGSENDGTVDTYYEKPKTVTESFMDGLSQKDQEVVEKDLENLGKLTIPKEKQKGGNSGKKILTGALAGGLVLSGGAALAEDLNAKTVVVQAGEINDGVAGMGIKASAEVTPPGTISPPVDTEVPEATDSPTVTPNTEPVLSTPEAFADAGIVWDGLGERETKEIKKWLSLTKEEQNKIRTDIANFWSSDSEYLVMPVYDPEVVRGMNAYYENLELKKYRDEMSEAGCEDPAWNLITAIGLRAWDKDAGINTWGNPDKFQNYVERDEIIRIGVEQDVSKVVLKNNGDPGILLFNSEGKNQKFGDGFRGMIESYKENGTKNIVEILNYNGMYLFSPIIAGTDFFQGSFSRFKVYYISYEESDLKDISDLTNIVLMSSYVESNGIAYRVFFNSLGISGTSFFSECLKDVLANDALLDLYKETNVEFYFKLAGKHLKEANSEAKDLSRSLDEPKFLESVKFMKYYNIVSPLVGESWKIDEGN